LAEEPRLGSEGSSESSMAALPTSRDNSAVTAITLTGRPLRCGVRDSLAAASQVLPALNPLEVVVPPERVGDHHPEVQ